MKLRYNCTDVLSVIQTFVCIFLYLPEQARAVYLWRNFVNETGLLGHQGPLGLLGLGLLARPRLAPGGDGWRRPRPGVTERVGHGQSALGDSGDGEGRSQGSQLLYCYDKLRSTGPRISCPLTIDTKSSCEELHCWPLASAANHQQPPRLGC